MQKLSPPLPKTMQANKAVKLPYWGMKNIYLGVILDLHKSSKDSTKSFHIPFSQISLM